MKFKNPLSWICKFFAVALVLYSYQAFAIGLGELEVHSYLNDPLDADIIITGMADLDPNYVSVGLASSKDFLRAGVARPGFLSSLKFAIKKSNNGLKVKIYTEKVMKEPFLDFLVELIWPEGTIVKSYTILLDPKPIDLDSNNNSSNIPSPQLSGSPNSVLPPNFNLNNFSNNNKIESLKSPNKFDNQSISTNPIGSTSSESIDINPLETTATKTTSISPQNKANQSSLKSINPVKTKEFKEKDPKKDKDPTATAFSLSTEDLIAEDQDLPVTNNNQSGEKDILGKVIKSLQVFAENSTNSKANYEKLLHLQPNVVALSKQDQLMAEQGAIAQINSELNSLRNNNPFKIMDNQPNKTVLTPNVQNGEYQTAANNLTNKDYSVYYANGDGQNYKLDLSTKDPNQLLWALFLVTTTIFIFYKMLPTKHLEDGAVEKSMSINSGFSDFLTNNQDYHAGSGLQQINTNQFVNFNDALAVVGQTSGSSKTIVSSSEHTAVHSKIEAETAEIKENGFFVRNEELELKMALANQYIAAGDSKSARELLEEIINVKEQRYHSQIVKMLKTIS